MAWWSLERAARSAQVETDWKQYAPIDFWASVVQTTDNSGN
jgi:hypothetical protein